MSLFQRKNSKLIEIQEEPFKLERDLQRLTEENLETIFGLEFVKTEFPVEGLEIDTLAYDKEKNAFVIIEYKRDGSFSIVDQGLSYLSRMFKYKAEFILGYNEEKKANLKREDIDWSQSRVLFLARSFTTHQQNAINFRNLPIELWEVTQYNNNSVLYNRVQSEGAAESIEVFDQNPNVKKVSREVKEYIEEDVVPKNSKAEKLYQLLKKKVLVIEPNFTPHVTKFYIGFRIPGNWRIVFAVWSSREKLRVDFTRSKPQDFKDPEKKVYYRKDSFKQYNQHLSRMDVESEKDVEYAVYLIGQLYDRFKKM